MKIYNNVIQFFYLFISITSGYFFASDHHNSKISSRKKISASFQQEKTVVRSYSTPLDKQNERRLITNLMRKERTEVNNIKDVSHKEIFCNACNHARKLMQGTGLETQLQMQEQTQKLYEYFEHYSKESYPVAHYYAATMKKLNGEMQRINEQQLSRAKSVHPASHVIKRSAPEQRYSAASQRARYASQSDSYLHTTYKTTYHIDAQPHKQNALMQVPTSRATSCKKST